MDRLYFGTAGVPLSATGSSSVEGIARVQELGLGCMELEFVNGVSMGEKTARLVAEQAERYGVKLSAHGPYYINLNSREPAKITASRQRIFSAARIAALCGAESVIFHPAFYHDDHPEVVLERVVDNLLLVREDMEREGIKIILRPETTGKGSQFGNLQEVIELSRRVSGVLPCIDFSHLHARSGGASNTLEEFRDILKEMELGLGREALDNVHFHISGINYGPKGERNHLILEESDFDYLNLIKVFKEYDLKGLVICESPNLEIDALKLAHAFEEAK